MGNNDQHIDDFLFLKLNPLEQLPDEGIFSLIIKNVANSHPIDYALHGNLNDLRLFPDTNSEPHLFDAITGNEHMIDATLYRKLENLEETPVEQWPAIAAQFNYFGNRSRKWVFLLLFAAISAFSAFYLFNRNGQDKNHSIAHTLSQSGSPDEAEGNLKNNAAKNSSSTGPEKNISKGKTIKKVEDKNEGKYFVENRGGLKNGKGKDRNLDRGLTGRSNSFIPRQTFSDANHGLQEGNSNTSLAYADGENVAGESAYLKANKLLKIKSGSRPDQISEIFGSEAKARSYFKKKLSPFFMGVNFGYVNEHTIQDKISSKNVHKDAVAVFGQATGKDRKGYNIGLFAGYRLHRNLSVKLGILYSRTAINSTLNYTYTDVPVKDSATGKIVTYYKRTVRNSPKVESENTNENIAVYMPVGFSAKVLETNKFSVWGELGARVLLNSKFSTRLFSFDDGALTNLNIVKLQRVIPTAAINLQYQFLPDIHFAVGIHLGYQRKTFYIDDYSYLKTEFVPGFNFGIIYNPLIRK